MQHLKNAYDSSLPGVKNSIALALFQIAGNQPGLYVDNKALLKDIKQERLLLDHKSTVLLEQKQTLHHALERLTAEIVLLEKSAVSAPISSSSKMALLLSGASNREGLMQSKKTIFERKQQEMVEIDTQLTVTYYT